MPDLQYPLLILFDDPLDLAKLMIDQSLGSGQPNRFQPEFGRRPPRADVDVRRFAAVVGVEVQPIWPDVGDLRQIYCAPAHITAAKPQVHETNQF